MSTSDAAKGLCSGGTIAMAGGISWAGHTEDPSAPSYGPTVTWCGIGVCGLDVRLCRQSGLACGPFFSVDVARHPMRSTYSYVKPMTPFVRIEAMGCRAGHGEAASRVRGNSPQAREGFFNREGRNPGKKKDGTTERSNKLPSGCIDPDNYGMLGRGKCGYW